MARMGRPEEIANAAKIAVSIAPGLMTLTRPAGFELVGPGAGERSNGGLAGAIVAEALKSPGGVDRTVEDDGTAIPQ
jgi:hypothetical protein